MLRACLVLIPLLVLTIACSSEDDPPTTSGIEDQIRQDCPSEFRAPCVDVMTRLLSLRSDQYGRIALCVNATGNWTTAAEKGSPPSESLRANSKVGDACPGSSPDHTIKAIYVQRAGSYERE